MNTASFFDLDGTLTKGYMITKFAKHLMEAGLFPKNGYSKIDSLKNLFLRKEMTYREIAVKLPEIYASSLKGNNIDEVNREATVFVEKIKKNNLYPYSKNLTTLMKSYGLTIGVSGSPLEVVKIIGKYFEFDLSYGTEVEVKDKIYTGRLKRNLIAKEGKETIFKTIMKQKKIDLSNSFGFGDTAQDLAFLSKVGNPIAVNPSQELLKIAKSNSWTICQNENTIINIIKKII